VIYLFNFQTTSELKIQRELIHIGVSFSSLVGTIEKYGQGKDQNKNKNKNKNKKTKTKKNKQKQQIYF
jgi:hypothetical protein